MVPATTSLTGFSGETIWPLGQLRLLVTIGDADHSIVAWMNFMIIRSLSPYNVVTIPSTILIPAESAMVVTSSKETPKEARTRHENFKIAPHPDFPDQEVAIEGLLPSPGNRLESRVSLRLSLQVLLGRLQRLSPDTNGRADEEKTTFYTTQGTYTEAGMLWDIEEMFCTLCKINMKLNPKKCTFGAVVGMFLGYTITPEGMKPCPNKTEVVLQLSSPRTIKEGPSTNSLGTRISPDQAGRTQETPLTVEVIPSIGNIPELKTASGVLKNRMAIPTLREPEPSMKTDLVMEINSPT
ncbi:hypothetical protein Tco_1285233 [Tanacetum coccineum]